MSKARQLVNDLQWAGIILVVYGVLLSAWLGLQWVLWFILEHSGLVAQDLQVLYK